jgi:hypothetical protein
MILTTAFLMHRADDMAFCGICFRRFQPIPQGLRPKKSRTEVLDHVESRKVDTRGRRPAKEVKIAPVKLNKQGYPIKDGRVDLSGQRFGEFLVLRQDPRPQRHICQCSCGKQQSIANRSLTNGSVDRCRPCRERAAQQKIWDEKEKKRNEEKLARQLRQKNEAYAKEQYAKESEQLKLQLLKEQQEAHNRKQEQQQQLQLQREAKQRQKLEKQQARERAKVEKLKQQLEKEAVVQENIHSHIIDLSGARFGELKVLHPGRKGFHLCRCNCGAEESFRNDNLLKGVYTKCTTCAVTERRANRRKKRELNAQIKEQKRLDRERRQQEAEAKGNKTPYYRGINLVGERFEKLVVRELIGEPRRWKWLCDCDCGNTTEGTTTSLTTGLKISCGCHLKVDIPEGLVCPRCNGTEFRPNGRHSSGVRKFACKDCGKDFTPGVTDRVKVSTPVKAPGPKLRRLAFGHINKGQRDFLGWNFGRLTAVALAGTTEEGDNIWECLCDCGCYKEFSALPLGRKGFRSCGECGEFTPWDDLLGETFGRLTVTEQVGTSKAGAPIWLAQCACGGQRRAFGENLLNGKYRSCGCVPEKRYVYEEEESKEPKG